MDREIEGGEGCREPLRAQRDRGMSFSKRKHEDPLANLGIEHQGIARFVPLVVYILIFSVHSILVKTTGKTGSYDYDPCLIIIWSECIKAALCLALFVREVGEAAFQSIVFAFIRHDWRMAGPAILLSVGNNLGFYNLLYYDPQMYMIMMNATRILVTAFFWSVLFGERITPRTWLACGTLTVGCVLANIDCAANGTSRFGTKPSRALDWLGQLTILLQASISSLSSVYSEVLLKHGGADVRPNLARQNFVLASLSLVVNCLYFGYGSDSKGERTLSPLSQMRIEMIILSTLLAFGGLCASVVLKRFSALTKAYATACEILLTGGLAALFLDSNLHLCFWLSFGFISSALVMYSKSGSEDAAQGRSLPSRLCHSPAPLTFECHGPLSFIEDRRTRSFLYTALLILAVWSVFVPAQLMEAAARQGATAVTSIPAMQLQLGVEFVEPAAASAKHARSRTGGRTPSPSGDVPSALQGSRSEGPRDGYVSAVREEEAAKDQEPRAWTAADGARADVGASGGRVGGMETLTVVREPEGPSFPDRIKSHALPDAAKPLSPSQLDSGLLDPAEASPLSLQPPSAVDSDVDPGTDHAAGLRLGGFGTVPDSGNDRGERSEGSAVPGPRAAEQHAKAGGGGADESGAERGGVAQAVGHARDSAGAEAGSQRGAASGIDRQAGGAAEKLGSGGSDLATADAAGRWAGEPASERSGDGGDQSGRDPYDDVRTEAETEEREAGAKEWEGADPWETVRREGEVGQQQLGEGERAQVRAEDSNSEAVNDPGAVSQAMDRAHAEGRVKMDSAGLEQFLADSVTHDDEHQRQERSHHQHPREPSAKTGADEANADAQALEATPNAVDRAQRGVGTDSMAGEESSPQASRRERTQSLANADRSAEAVRAKAERAAAAAEGAERSVKASEDGGVPVRVQQAVDAEPRGTRAGHAVGSSVDAPSVVSDMSPETLATDSRNLLRLHQHMSGFSRKDLDSSSGSARGGVDGRDDSAAQLHDNETA